MPKPTKKAAKIVTKKSAKLTAKKAAKKTVKPRRPQQLDKQVTDLSTFLYGHLDDLESQAVELMADPDVIETFETGLAVITTEPSNTSFVERIEKDQLIVYVMDESGSMRTDMEQEPGEYQWTPDVLDKFRQRIMLSFEDDIYNDSPEENEDGNILSQKAAERLIDDGLDDNDNLIKHIVDNNLIAGNPDIELVRGKETPAVTRNECMKSAMRQFVEQRFKKYPNSKVGVIGFSDMPTIRCEPGTSKADVLAAVDALRIGGGTSIAEAIRAGLDMVKRSPSPVQANHIILVTDGEDSKASAVAQYLKEMKQQNIVFDFIFIKGHSSTMLSNVAKTLKTICSETGGEYFEVSKASDFAQKLIEVGNRLCLPPAKV